MTFPTHEQAGWVTAAVAVILHAAHYLRGFFTMTNLPNLIVNAIRFASLSYQVEQIETDPKKDAPTKREEVVALLPQFVPLVDNVANLPAGTVEKYLTAEALGALYDGEILVETVVQKELKGVTPGT